MSRLSEAIAPVNDIEKDLVTIPSWDNVEIEVRGMNGMQRGAYLARLSAAREAADEDPEALAQVELEVLIQCLYDPEDGSLAFSEDDIPMLLTKSGGVIGMLSRKAIVASGLDADAEKRLGKSSSEIRSATLVPTTPSGASTSGSPIT